MEIKKTLKLILNISSLIVKNLIIITKFIIINIFSIADGITAATSGVCNTIKWLFILFVPSKAVSSTIEKYNIFHTQMHQKELDQNTELIKHITLFYENFTFLDNCILIAIMMINIYIIITSKMYIYYTQKQK